MRSLDLGHEQISTNDCEVWKFGGSSIATLDRLRSVVRKVVDGHRAGRKVVCVLSAMGATTDALDQLAHSVASSPSRRELDALLALGESASCALAAMIAEHDGWPARSLSGGRAGVQTDDEYGSALLKSINPSGVRQVLDDGAIPFVAGFQGVGPRGDVTTLGRGGSDASAVALAVALSAPQAQIFTDVDGVFTADPRLVEDARRLKRVGFDETVELAHAGARVLQTRAVLLAKAHRVALRVRSAHDPASEGTLVDIAPSAALESSGVVAVVHQPAQQLWSARGVGPQLIAAVLAKLGVELHFMARMSEGRIVFRAAGVGCEELSSALGVKVREEATTAEVSVVGPNAAQPRFVELAVRALTRVAIAPAVVHQYGPGRFACHVHSGQLRDTVNALHSTFITQGGTYD